MTSLEANAIEILEELDGRLILIQNKEDKLIPEIRTDIKLLCNIYQDMKVVCVSPSWPTLIYQRN
jgi:calcineurin-like phosphoesterase family protein